MRTRPEAPASAKSCRKPWQPRELLQKVREGLESRRVSTGARILYIEDDPGLSRLVRARLEADGYRVELCATGQAKG